jgi:hypothetical protein
MAVQYSFGQIVTSGLVLALNAADRNSYPGSGTVWSDLSGNNNTGTLTNGPTFSSANGGSIVFDGTNDYVEMTTRNTALEFQPTQPYSVFTWFRITSTQNSSTIVANMDNTGPNYPGWDLWFNNASTANTLAMHLISSWITNAIKIRVDFNYAANLNQWIYFGNTYDGSCPTTSGASLTSVNFYLNGSLYTTGKAVADNADGFNTSSETITYNTNQRFRIASRWSAGGASGASAEAIPIVQVYNRVLSTSEVLQNYNAQKSRFNL